MKAWRRSSSIAGVTTAATVPTIDVAQAGGTPSVFVQFSEDVTWNTLAGGTFEVNGFPGDWIAQVAGNILEWQDGGMSNHFSGEPWDWTAPDPTLTPVPSPSQTGTST